MTEGLDPEQRDEFDRQVTRALGGTAGSSTDAEMATRREFALREGQIG